MFICYKTKRHARLTPCQKNRDGNACHLEEHLWLEKLDDVYFWTMKTQQFTQQSTKRFQNKWHAVDLNRYRDARETHAKHEIEEKKSTQTEQQLPKQREVNLWKGLRPSGEKKQSALLNRLGNVYTIRIISLHEGEILKIKHKIKSLLQRKSVS